MTTLGEGECWERLAAARHGVLGTLHRARGVDAVPVVFAVVDGAVVVPIDAVKAKRTARLARLDNLRSDARCVLLVDAYDDDWSRLWWVRVHAHGAEAPMTDGLQAALAARYPPYREEGAVVAAIRLTPTRVTGWAAG